jgi:RHS repeat-associated protein
MPHLSDVAYDHHDQMRTSTRQVGGIKPETTYYVYDAAGQRVRKVTEDQTGTRKEERRYVGGFEVYRRYENDGVTIELERTTAHLMDDKTRIALVEHRILGDDGTAEQLIRYQHGNHLGTVSLELDQSGRLINYEEYSPYGSTVYQAVNAVVRAASKRYRYTGKERDEENGFTYHGARYYAPWLGRWTSCDPAGLVDGVNIFAYGHDSPIRHSDPNGTTSVEAEGARRNAARAERGELTPDQIGDVYKSADDVPKQIDTSAKPSPSRVQEQQNRLAQGASKRAQAKADEAKKPHHTVKQRQALRTTAANAGAQNTAVETVESLAKLTQIGALGPAAFALPSLHLDWAKAQMPAATGDALQDSINSDYYKMGGTAVDTTVLALSFVPIGEIAQGARMTAGKLPVPTGGLGNLGGQGFMSSSELWAKSADTAASEALPALTKRATPAPVFGKAQVTGPGHAETSLEVAAEMSEISDAKEIHLNRQINTVTEGEVASGRRPDVTMVSESGGITGVEVPSGSDVRSVNAFGRLIARNLKYMLTMPERSEGLFIVWIKP